MLLRPRALSSETRSITSMHCYTQLHNGLSYIIFDITVLSEAETSKSAYSQVVAMMTMMSDYSGVAENACLMQCAALYCKNLNK